MAGSFVPDIDLCEQKGNNPTPMPIHIHPHRCDLRLAFDRLNLLSAGREWPDEVHYAVPFRPL